MTVHSVPPRRDPASLACLLTDDPRRITMSPQPGSAKAGRAKGKSQPNKSPAGVAAPRPSDAVTPSGADEVPPSESASRIAASREQMPQDYGIPAIERSIHALDTSGVGGIGVVGSGPLHNAGDAASGSRQALSKPQSVGGSRASVSKSDLKKSQGLVMESGRVSAPVSPDDGHLGSADRFALPPLVPPPSFPPLPFNASNAPEIGSIEVILPESATAETPVAETPSTPGQPLLHTVSSRIATPPAFPSNFPPLPVDLPMTPSYFAVGPRDLARIVDFDRRQDADWIAETFWAECGGPGGIASMLRTNLARGLECIEVHKAEDKKRSSGTASGCLAKLLNRRAKVAPVSTAPKVVPTDLKRRTAQFGVNRIPPPPRPTLLSLVIGTIKEDLIVRILLAGALVILAVGTATHPATGWYEGLAILCAVGIVLGVTSLNDWIKEGKFRKMAELRGDKTAKVLRSGKHMTISHYDILAGDIVLLSVGDEVPGDGFIVSSSRLACDESPLTGEPIAVRKDSSAPFVFGGTYVAEGEGIMCITAVGRYSMGGAIQELLFRGAKPDERGDENEDDDDAEQTPLQRRLKGVALQIGKLGFTAGLITFFALAIRWGVVVGQHIANGGEWKWELLLELVNFFVIGVTVIVVAVPEGLPLAVTISLAFSMFRMVRDRCFVRHLDASETMGEATCICTDKTGTLTENRMTVVRVLCGGKESNLEESGVGSIARVEADLLGEAISVNSTAFLKPVLGTEARASQPEFVGSATEGALLVFAGKLGYDYEKLRESNEKAEDGVWPFSSKRKRMATLIVRQREGGIGYRLHVKGASEIVLGLCDRTVGEAGRVIHMPPSRRAVIEAKIREWASEGLRTLVLAYRDMAELPRIDRQGDDDENTVEQNLIFLCLAGIKDPVRKEVPAAVRACQHAGMVVRMVTGDNVLTATKIATECGILDSGEGHIAIEGPQFRSMSDAERREVLPKMRVLARSSPTDKFVLVSLLKYVCLARDRSLNSLLTISRF